MPDTVRHVSIHWACDSDAERSGTVDVSLPAALTVGELLPWIVDALDAGDGTPRRWRLTLLGGHLLEESATVAHNDVRDGDLLVLTGTDDQPDPAPTEIALLTGPPADGDPAGVRILGCLWTAGLGCAALVWAGLDRHGVERWAATALATVTGAAVAMAAPRLGVSTIAGTALNIMAVGLAAVLGFLAVPAGPAAANLFLAAVAAGSLATIVIRVSQSGIEIVLAMVVIAAQVAITTGIAVTWPVSPTGMGAMLSGLGIGLLSLAPRLSIALAGLTPDLPGTRLGDVPDRRDDADVRAHRAHRYLVGMVVGCSATAAAGTGIITAAGLPRIAFVEICFTAAVALALLLRSRSFARIRCRIALIIAGFLALTATFTQITVAAPGSGGWVGVAAVGVGIAIGWPVTVDTPLTARLADALECALLAAVLPLACWLTGAFDLAAGLVGR